ncbi:hypothetical protein [Streptomyces sp. NPDC047046]|uniref:hypothetical protein n=1 Tax=Streptomyces sp. NPDC047046 TaxID=3155378 RepID=UPI0033DD7824
MVTAPHEALHRVFLQDKTLYARVLRLFGVEVGEPSVATEENTDLTETRPLERRLDGLLRVKDPGGGEYLIALESQIRVDPLKPAAWAYYVAHLMNKHSLPVLLLITTQSRRVARWAAGPHHHGLADWPALTMRPLVVGPDTLDPITDPDAAGKDLALTALTVMTQVTSPTVFATMKALSTALSGQTESIAGAYLDLVAAGLANTEAGTKWRDLMATDLSFFTSPLSEELREEGQVKEAAGSVLRVLGLRGFDVSDEVRDRVEECQNLATLHDWLDKAVTATTLADVFVLPGE